MTENKELLMTNISLKFKGKESRMNNMNYSCGHILKMKLRDSL